MAAPTSDRLAVLIDADNAQASIAGELLIEIARYGTATVKRAYGDWTTSNLGGWKEALLKHAIQPMQQFRYTTGKNATDSALIIDAMDLLHGGRVDGFCLISSDSDFTRLATRIREGGLMVYGFGQKKTPKPLVAACNKFIYTEILGSQPAEKGTVESELEPLQPMLLQAISDATREDGWAALGVVGSLITKSHPSFDSRNYGFPKLSELVLKQRYLETRSEPTADGTARHLYVKVKPPTGRRN